MDVAQLHERLSERAFLHDDPEAYIAGVDDALALLAQELATADGRASDERRRGA